MWGVLTVDQGLNVVNACKSLGIPTIPCLGHRIHSFVMWGVGVSGSVAKQKNKKGRALVGRCAACAGMFTHSCTNSDAFRLVQETMHVKQREEMEQFRIDASAIEEAAEGATPATAAAAATEGIPKALNICRRNDTRCDIFLFFVRSSRRRRFCDMLHFCIPLYMTDCRDTFRWERYHCCWRRSCESWSERFTLKTENYTIALLHLQPSILSPA